MSFTSTLPQVSEKPAVLRAYAGRCLGRLVLALAFTVFGMSFASSTAWSSQVPHDMTYQGQLTDSVGAPLSGPVDLKLRIFDLLSDGSALYAEDHTGVSLDDEGGFSVQLGAGSASTGSFDPSLFAGVNRYLEVVVDDDVLAPRQVLGSVPWALVAEDVLFNPTNNIGSAITDAQNTADSALSDAATAAAGHTVDTTLNESQVDAFVANNGYSAGAHTTDTNTQLTNSQVRTAALAEGFVAGAHTTNTTLNEAQVDAFVVNNGYAEGEAFDALETIVAYHMINSGIQPYYNHSDLRNEGNLYSSWTIMSGYNVIAGNNLYYQGGVLAASDMRLKKNVEPIEDALAAVQDLRGVTFHMRDEGDDEPRRYGFIAQEVLEVLPDLVSLGPDGEYYSVDYAAFVGLLTTAIQEQAQQIEELGSQNQRLLRTNKSFAHRLKRVEKRLSNSAH